MVGFVYAKPTISIKERDSVIFFCLFWPVGWLFVFELYLYLFSRLCLPWYPSFLREIDYLFVKGSLNNTSFVTVCFLGPRSVCQSTMIRE
jgi:hypothetical protein